MENRAPARHRYVRELNVAAKTGLAITAVLTFLAVISTEATNSVAAENVKALTLCVSWGGEPEPPVRMQINQRPASFEFTKAKAIDQFKGVDLNQYEGWIPGYYFLLRPPSRIQNCVGTVLETILKLPDKYNASSDDFYKQVLRPFATEIKRRSDLQVGDIVCWIKDEHCGHVGYVVHPDPVVVLTKDGDQATYLHLIFRWSDDPRSHLGRSVDPLVNVYGNPRFFRLTLSELRVSVSEPGSPCRGEVPDLAGLTPGEADEAVGEAGLVPLGRAGDHPPPTDREAGMVYDQDPQAGSMLDEGELVHFNWYPAASGTGPKSSGKKAEVTVTRVNMEDLTTMKEGAKDVRYQFDRLFEEHAGVGVTFTAASCQGWRGSELKMDQLDPVSFRVEPGGSYLHKDGHLAYWPLSPEDLRKGRLKCTYIGTDDNGNEIKVVDDIRK